MFGKMNIKLTLFLVILQGLLFAGNPILPPGVFMADPAAHVWNDTLYIYGSVDESTDYYCSYRYHVLSTVDMKHWKIHKNVFHSRGEKDQIPYSDALLFAPDCQYRNGTYYLYYCQPDRENAEGVATSNSPTGPFENGRKIDVKGYNEIDPCTFIDDDGQAYYMWGQFSLKMAPMKSNMIEIDKAEIKTDVITEAEHYFHEGAHLVKRKDTYYMIYAHIGRADRPTCIGYATATKPMGPYEYGGVIIDNDHCDPEVWNNHGSIFKFKGQWYVFYHRSTHASRKMRKMCIEPISFNPDGSIDEVQMTTQGVEERVDAFSRIDAARACLLHGDQKIISPASDQEIITNIRNGDKAAYKYLDFKDGVASISVRIRSNSSSGTLILAYDMPWGPDNIGKIPIGNTNNKWRTITYNLDSQIQGKHTLWLQFYCDDDGRAEIDWFEFSAE